MNKKIVKIEGMMCEHCQAHVEKALNALPHTTAVVELENKRAIVTGEASDASITAAVTEAGYTVACIEAAP